MSTSAVIPFRSFVQTPIFSVCPLVFRRYSIKHHHHLQIMLGCGHEYLCCHALPPVRRSATPALTVPDPPLSM